MAKKTALCIGINDYPGTGSDLRGCVIGRKLAERLWLDSGQPPGPKRASSEHPPRNLPIPARLRPKRTEQQ